MVFWLASLAPPPRLRRYSPVPLPLHGGEVLDGPAAGAEDFSPTKRLAEWGSGTKCRGGAVRRTAGKPRWFPGSLRSRPSPPPAVLPRSAAAPRGRGVGRPCRWSRGFLPHEAVSGVGEWHEVPRGRGPQDRRETTVVSWLASLAPPPRLRRCSPVPLPLHGGEVHGRNLLVCPSCPISPSTSTPWRSGCSGCP